MDLSPYRLECHIRRENTVNDLAASRHHPLLGPFFHMLAFWLALDVVSDLSAIPFVFLAGKISGMSPFVPGLAAGVAVRIGIGILFIRSMNRHLRPRATEPAANYLLPAVMLAVGAAAVRYGVHLVFAPEQPLLNQFGPLPARAVIMGLVSGGVYGAVEAFILCGVVQEYLSRRGDGSFRLLGREISSAVPLVALVATALPAAQFLITALRGGGGVMGLMDTLLFGAVVFGYSYGYSRSRSLIAPVIAGSLYGVLYGLLPVILGGR